jgi:outer membrane biosynthesis protein TonB
MNSNWDINNIRRIAGLPLNEAWDRDDDDEDPDVKIANSDKGQQAFEKKNKDHLDDNAAMLKKRTADQKAAAAKKKAEAPKPAEKKAEPAKAEEKPAEKKEEPKKEEKKEVAAAEAKRRGKAPNPESFNQHAKAKAKSMTRSAFIAWAAADHNKGKNYASTLFAKYNPKSSREVQAANEMWILTHPYLKGYTLAENRELNQMQWVDSNSSFDTMCFVTEAEAKKVATYMEEWKSQQTLIEHIVFED